MLRNFLIVFIFSLISVLSFAKNNLPTPHKTLQQLDTIVATVNNDIVTKNELNSAISLTKKQFEQRHLPIPDEKTLQKKVLKNLINRQLQLQLAKQHGIKASKKEINQHIQMIANQNHLTLSQLKTKVTAQGLSYDAFKKQIHDQVIMGKVQQQMIAGSVSVTDPEIQAFRTAHANDINTMLFHIGDILIPVTNIKNPSEKSKAHSDALALMRTIRKGGSVKSAVKKYHAQYTDLGKRRLSDIPSLFSKPIISTKINGIAGPILAPNGYHVLHLIEKQSGVSQLSDKQIRNILMQQKYEKGINDALEKIRKNAYIKINPDYE